MASRLMKNNLHLGNAPSVYTFQVFAMLRILVAIALFALTAPLSHADEPKKNSEPEKLPAPKVKVEPSIIVMPYIPPRTDTRDVWQHYGVNAFGRFVPRVITAPHGAYYSRDLTPYPWVPNRQTAILPLTVN